jgi:amino acid adenylation domain-containing protein
MGKVYNNKPKITKNINQPISSILSNSTSYFVSSIIYPSDKTIVDQLEEVTRHYPENIAFVFEGETLTFRELNEKSNRIACYLIKRGITTESLVPFCMEKSITMMVTIFGILKSGAAYVPIDPNYPLERIQFILGDIGANLLLVNNSLNKKFDIPNTIDLLEYNSISSEPVETFIPEIKPTPDNLAYVIYTSGSTGNPKGVMVPHRGLMDHCFGLIERANLKDCKSFAITAPIVFDAGHSLIHIAIIQAATTHHLSDHVILDSDKFTAYLQHHKIDCLKIVPSLWLSHTEGGLIPLPKRKLIFGGENFPVSILSILRKSDFKGDVFNHYGPTEASIGKCIYKVDLNRTYSQVPIGRPFSNTFILLLDSNLKKVGDGEAGEIYIGGEGIARGYLNLPLITAKSFIPDSISGKKGGFLYRTGDLGKSSEDGNLLYLGRVDDQVKINGYRIEPGEIEATIYQYESIKQIAVVANTNKQKVSLAAYFVLEKGSLEEDIKHKLKSILPAHMIPQYWIQMEEMPLTSNGKINKKALPEPDWTSNLKSKNPPQTKTEKLLISLWEKFLGWENIGIYDNFFDLGGNSLLAIRTIAGIKQSLRKRLMVKDFFNSPTVFELSRVIDETNVDLHEITPALKVDFIPLSFNQEALWVIHNSEGSLQYHLPMIFGISGDLDIKSLKLAFRTFINRHLPLRTVIKASERGLEQKFLDAESWSIQEIISNQTEDEIMNDWPFKSMVERPFNLSEDFMIRVALFHIQQKKFLLNIVVHHIAWDGWSTSLFKDEIAGLYRKIRSGNQKLYPSSVLTYADFSIYQRNLLGSKLFNDSLKYWQGRLKGTIPIQLRTDYPRTALFSPAGETYEFIIDKDIVSKLNRLAIERNATLFMILLAGFKALLKRYSAQEDIIVGIPVAGREHEGLEDLIGFFVNSLPIRTKVDGNYSFDDLLNQIKTNTLEAFEHGHVPFSEIVKLSDDFRITGRNPIFQVLFVMQNNTSSILNLDGVNAQPVKAPNQTSSFELTLEIKENQDQLIASMEYQTALYSSSTISRMSGHYLALLEAITLNPKEKVDNLNLLNLEEKNFVLAANKDFVLPEDLKEKTILALIEEQVKLFPQHIAISFNGYELSYSELDKRANKVANFLLNKGVGRSSLVPICLDNSTEMIVGLLGIIKTGAAYIPLDPTFPRDRIKFILDEVKASWVLTDSDNAPIFKENYPNLSILTLDSELNGLINESFENPGIIINPDEPVYLIYTSGTTGKPKGVIISHKGLFLSTFSRINYYPDKISILLLPSFSFDSSIATIFGALSQGSKIVLGKSEQLKDPGELKKLLSLTNSILCVPSFYRFLLTERLIPTNQIKRVILGGERLDPSLLALHFESNKGAGLYNEYGPTEATVWATVCKLTSPKAPITIGKPIPHIKVYIVDASGNLCPVGIPGELCISGASLAIGYFNNPEMTAASFIPDPFSNGRDLRMYKTGDKARLLNDGSLEYLGRLDNQVKLRGYRIELEEIETLLETLDFVKKAIVSVIGDFSDNQKLVAHILTNKETASHSEDLQTHKLTAHLSDNLPPYMVPVQWEFLEDMPFTPNGKIDRKKLSQIESRTVIQSIWHNADNVIAQKLLIIWRKLLNIDQIATHDNFFKIGGNSLLAIRLINSIREEFDYVIKFSTIFANPTINQLAKLIEDSNAASCSDIEFKSVPHVKEYPLSFSQESIWITDKLEGSVHYHIPLLLNLEGKLDVAALEKALQAIYKKHEILRTQFHYNGEKVYQKVNGSEPWNLMLKDASKEVWDNKTFEEFIQGQISLPFDLSNDAMFRALLIQKGPTQNTLLLVFHHIAFDGWSIGLIMEEIHSFYTQQKNIGTIDFDPLPLQYGDYAIWQRAQLQGAAFDNKIDYWKNKLKDLHPLSITNSMAVMDVDATNGDTQSFLIPAQLQKSVEDLAHKTDTTMYMVLMATFKILLYQLSRNTDICVGTVIADRNYKHTDKLLGYFINTLPIRSQLNPEKNLIDFLCEVKTNCLEAFDYQEVPFEKIVAAVQPERKLGNNPIFQVMFLLQNTFNDEAWEIDDLKVKMLQNKQKRAKFDLLFTVSEGASGLKGLMEYKTSLFNSAEINKIIENYLYLLETLLQNPLAPLESFSRNLEVEIKEETEQFEDEFKDEFRPVQKLIESATIKYRDKVAIISKEKYCTYDELNASSNQLADLLSQQGIGRNDIVGIVMDRSIEMITAIMAVLKVGAAYLPVDTDFPDERINYMLKDAAKVHITHTKYKGKLKSQSIEILWEEFKAKQGNYSKENPSPNNEANDMAYIIYTSGSTGKPKGVMLTHGNLYNFLKTVSQKPGITANNKFLAVSSASFDIALLELILPFVHGAQIVILDQFERKDPRVILQYLTQNKADIMFATPTHWKMLLESGWKSPVDNLQIISGGEALSKDLASRLLPLCDGLWNIYGPTETTVFSTIKKIEANQPIITIGREVLNTKIYLLDENQKPVPKGMEGEIYISGKGVAKGYLNQPELTNQKFSKDPFQSQLGACMYKTGDRARFLPDGEIHILGRIDNQIKLRGHRIELEEIEQAINELNSVNESVVLYRKTSRNDMGLVAYLLLKDDLEDKSSKNIEVTSTQVKRWKKELSLNLPVYMMPFDYVVVDHFPHTASGKIDRLKLPDPKAMVLDVVLLPNTEKEKKIAEIWKAALGIEKIDITDNFFDLGGHSLIAVKVMTQIEKEFGTLLPLSILFKYPTIQQLGLFLETNRVLTKEWKSLVPIQPKGKKDPIYIVHGAGLNVMPFQSIAKYFDPEQPIYGIQSKGMDGESPEFESIEEIAASYIDEIMQNHPQGNIILGGYSMGGIIAFEMAKQLAETNISVKYLFLLDSFATFAKSKNTPKNKLAAKLYREWNKKFFDIKLLFRHPNILRDIKSRSIGKKINGLLVKLRLKTKISDSPIIERINKIKAMHLLACKNYSPGFYEGEIIMIRAKIRTKYFFDPEYLGWKDFSKSMRVIDIECIHSDMFTAPNESELAAIIKQVIEGVEVIE